MVDGRLFLASGLSLALSHVASNQDKSSMSTSKNEDWIKVDLHIHTLDDPKDALDYSAHQLLERAKQLGFGVLAITLHDTVFDRAEVFAAASAMGILLVPAAEVRLQGADIILLNVSADEVAALKTFNDVRQLRARRCAGARQYRGEHQGHRAQLHRADHADELAGPGGRPDRRLHVAVLVRRLGRPLSRSQPGRRRQRQTAIGLRHSARELGLLPYVSER